MEGIDFSYSEELLFMESSEVIDGSVLESQSTSESETVSESESVSEEEAALAPDQVEADLKPIVSVLDDIHSEVVTLNEGLITCNGLLLALLFFTVAQWVVSKVKGSVERMLNWKI